jgi:hypothetical protein
MAPLVSKAIRTAVTAFLGKDDEEYLALAPLKPSPSARSPRLMALTGDLFECRSCLCSSFPARKQELKFILRLRYSPSGVTVAARYAVDKIERIEVSEVGLLLL